MKKAALSLLVLLALSTVASASPFVGQHVLIRVSATRTFPAVITHVNSGDNVNLVAYLDPTTSGTVEWPHHDDCAETPYAASVTFSSWWYVSIDKGTGTCQWQDNPSANGPKGDTGDTGPQGPAGADGANGANGTNGTNGTNGIGSSITTSTPSRTIGSAGFQPSTTKYTLVSYTLSVDAALSLTGGAKGRVELRSDSSSTPTTVRCAVGNGNTGTLTVGLNTTQNATAPCTYIVPPGDYVRLVSVTDSGTPTFSVLAQFEQNFDQ